MLEDFPEKRHNTLKINAIERDLSEWHSKGQEFDSPMPTKQTENQSLKALTHKFTHKTREIYA